MKIKKYSFIILIIVFINQNLKAIENRILFKIDSEIITSIEIFKYSNYLIALDENIRNLNDKEIFELTKNSIIKEKIKKIKLKNEGLALEIDDKVLNNYIETVFSDRGIKNFTEYEEFLNDLDIEPDFMREILTINLLWNNLIFRKFSSKIKINKDDLEKQIKDQKSNNSISYLLSEIFFEAKDKSTVNKKYKEIIKYIGKENFRKAALIYSKADTSKDGGSLGWISAKALNKNILKPLSLLETNGITNPIPVPGGFLIIKLEDKKLVKNNLNLEKELDNLIKVKTNQQLNQFSNIYFNKIKKEILIYEF